MARAVLTTGANSGIGLATVLELGRRGYRSIGSVRSETKAEMLHRAAADAGVTVEPVVLDVTDAEACARVVPDLELYGLVQLRGSCFGGRGRGHRGRRGPVAPGNDGDRADAAGPARAAVHASSTRGPHRQHLLDARPPHHPVAGLVPSREARPRGVSDALRTEVAGAGVSVVLIEPGGVNTAMPTNMLRMLDERSGSRYTRAYARSSRLARLVEPSLLRPGRCATTIADVLDARFPRARYVVGLDAHMSILASRLTPTPLKDAVLRFALGL